MELPLASPYCRSTFFQSACTRITQQIGTYVSEKHFGTMARCSALSIVEQGYFGVLSASLASLRACVKSCHEMLVMQYRDCVGVCRQEVS